MPICREMSSKISEAMVGSGGFCSCSSWFNLSSRLQLLELLKVLRKPPVGWRVEVQSDHEVAWFAAESIEVPWQHCGISANLKSSFWFWLCENNSEETPQTKEQTKPKPKSDVVWGAQLSPSYSKGWKLSPSYTDQTRVFSVFPMGRGPRIQEEVV